VVLLMVLYLVGLGLGDVEDITLRGLNAVKKCSKVYLEAYTSILSYGLSKTQLEESYGREIEEADREFVESACDGVLNSAKTEDIALLVVGDPFGATTHSDLVLRAKSLGTPVKVIHNASIVNAVGCCGLQLYSFGEIVSIVMWTENWQPDSYYDKIRANRERGLHTLCLLGLSRNMLIWYKWVLDIKTKEQSVENLMKGRKIFEPPRYLTCAEAAGQLLEIAKRRKANGETLAYENNTMVVGLARVGWDDQKIVYCSLEEMNTIDMGSPLHSLIIPGHTHPLEDDMLRTFTAKP
jgi:diphthine synthase